MSSICELVKSIELVVHTCEAESGECGTCGTELTILKIMVTDNQDLAGIPKEVLEELPQILSNLIAADNEIRQESVISFQATVKD